MTRQKLSQLGWEILIHPPYSPDIVPSDFYLFRSLQNSFNGKNLNVLEDCKRHLEQFFVQKESGCGEKGTVVHCRWKCRVGNNFEFPQKTKNGTAF